MNEQIKSVLTISIVLQPQHIRYIYDSNSVDSLKDFLHRQNISWQPQRTATNWLRLKFISVILIAFLFKTIRLQYVAAKTHTIFNCFGL